MYQNLVAAFLRTVTTDPFSCRIDNTYGQQWWIYSSFKTRIYLETYI